MSGEDVLNEYLIGDCYRQMMAAADRETQQHWFRRMSEYVGRRSPERVREMELERGLV